MKLSEYVDRDTLDDLIKNGYVSCKAHNEFPLRIYNYTKRASSLGFNRWPQTLERCRGLIVDSDDNIVAFGLPKFWNYKEEEDNGMDFDAYDKVDGSIGIVYAWEGRSYISTRGSFHSEMADWANDFLLREDNYDYHEFLNDRAWRGGVTPHVEIVYKDNRIVVDYDYEDLVLLGQYSTFQGWEPAQHTWRYPGRIAEPFEFKNMQELSDAHVRDNAEGFVLVYEDGTMKKIKYHEYLTLQRAIMNMTEKAIYNKLIVSEEELNEWILGLPNELQPEAYEIRDALKRQYAEQYKTLHMVVVSIRYGMRSEGLDISDRKALALYMQEKQIPGWMRSCMFALKDENPKAITAALWKQVKP